MPTASSRRRAASKKSSRSSASTSPRRGTTRAALELRALQQFRTVFASVRRHDSEVRRVARISGSQLWALSEIGKLGGMRVNDLSERMALHQTTASNIVNALVERKLVRRARDMEDQRVVRLFLTKDGERLLKRAPGPFEGLLVDALRQLGVADLTDLCKRLVALRGCMRKPASEAAGESLLGE